MTAKWKKIYYIYKGDKPPVLDKEKSRKKGDAQQGWGDSWILDFISDYQES